MVSNHTSSNRAARGFTLIELLASMTILIFIVMMMTRMFAETTNIWSLSTKRSYTSTEGRVIMDFIVKELTQAVADEDVSFKLNSGGDTRPGNTPLYGVSSYGAASDELSFVGVVRSGDPNYRRSGNQFVYFVAPMLDENSQPMTNRYRLVRTRRTTSMYNTQEDRDASAYRDMNWYTNMIPDWKETGNPALRSIETIAENVAGFEVWAYSEALGDYEFSYTSTNRPGVGVNQQNNNMLPLWLDIYLEILGEDEAKRAAILWDSNEDMAKEYVENNVKRFTSRVFFPNRERAKAF